MNRFRPVTPARLDVEITQKTINRFWSKVDKKGRNECWEWKAYSIKGKYGQFGIKNRVYLAHRIAWMIENGKIPAINKYRGYCVCHKCDNPKCVNPNHLFLGTNEENVHDMDSKGRRKLDPRIGVYHGLAKLDDFKVIEIRKNRNEGVKLKTLAKKFGVSEAVISSVARRKTWRHVP